MNWTTSRDLRAQLQRGWDRGRLLADLATGETSFPLRLKLKGPTSAQMAGRFETVRAWIAELRGLRHYRVEMRQFNHRVLGANQVPAAVWVDTLDDALAVLGKRREAERFAALVEHTRERRPELVDWLARRPLRALELVDVWDRLLDVIDWMEANPRPGIYLRQVDIPRIDSKFIEAYRGILIQWLDRILPPAAVDTAASGFPGRYGFREKPRRIRWRMLDPACTPLPGLAEADVTLDLDTFTALQTQVSQVFVTENEINFLAFPPMSDSLVIFGAGYGLDLLERVSWLRRCRVYYWGDIDTHGFTILDRLRAHLPHVRSLMMDRATLLAFEAQWGVEEKQTLRDLPRLTAEEQVLYDDLRDNRLRANLRLEQERVGFGWVEDALSRLRV